MTLANLTAGFACDGTGHGSLPPTISIADFYATPTRSGWSLTRTGKAYCSTCTPRINPVPPPPRPSLPEPISIKSAPWVRVWHVDAYGHACHDVIKRSGVRFLKHGVELNAGTPLEVFVPWGDVIKLEGKQQ
ncbi:hypothetical protein ACIA8O_39925 [Kitasatospora sp. NPDC051853]|uniref:hypothetical protein n=1 Tax=Kitasatospora sp. NPDC051853 TaxID=3364058 RepID=UPI0037B8A62B